MEFGDRLKAARNRAELSQEQLGKGLGENGKDVTKQTVWGWESGEHFPKVDQLALICGKLRVTADELVFGSQSDLSAEARQLARDFDALSERQKRTLRTLWTAFIRDAVADADVAEHLPAAPLEIDLTRSPKPPKRRSA